MQAQGVLLMADSRGRSEVSGVVAHLLDGNPNWSRDSQLCKFFCAFSYYLFHPVFDLSISIVFTPLYLSGH